LCKSHAGAQRGNFTAIFDVFRIETQHRSTVSLYVLLPSRMPPSEKTPHVNHGHANMNSSERRTSAAPARFERDSVMKITGGLLLLLAVSLVGCIHATGPCYGVGCHAFTTPSAGQSQGAQSQAAPQQSSHGSQAADAQSNAPAGKKSHGIHGLLKKIKL
jgi:hypothetical protein